MQNPNPTPIIEKLLGEFEVLWNEHDGTHFYKDEWKSFLKSALEEVYNAGREAEAIGCSDHCEKAKKEALEKISKKCEELGIDGEATVFEDVAVPHSCVEYRAALQTIIAYLDIKI